MPVIDTSTDLGKRLDSRLREEHVIWLTTVGKDGTPQPSPVWFHREGDEITIFSQPNTPKIRNIGRSPAVSLNLNASAEGGDVGVLTGIAEIVPDGPKANEIDAYVAKYAEGFTSIGMTAAEMAASYSITIRVKIDRVRGW